VNTEEESSGKEQQRQGRLKKLKHFGKNCQ
jgi:hypothetical protein